MKESLYFFITFAEIAACFLLVFFLLNLKEKIDLLTKNTQKHTPLYIEQFRQLAKTLSFTSDTVKISKKYTKKFLALNSFMASVLKLGGYYKFFKFFKKSKNFH